jgi:hypothetical protein
LDQQIAALDMIGVIRAHRRDGARNLRHHGQAITGDLRVFGRLVELPAQLPPRGPRDAAKQQQHHKQQQTTATAPRPARRIIGLHASPCLSRSANRVFL